MTSKKKIGGLSMDAMLLTAIKLVTTALGLATTRLLSEYLSVYDYGTYSQVLLVVSTVSSLTILGMMDGANYFYCGERDLQKKEAYIATILAIQCTIGVVAGAIVLLLSAPLCSYFDNPGVRNLLIFAAALPLLQNVLGVFQVLLVSVGKARMLAIRNFIISIARLAVVLVVALFVQNIVIVLTTTLILDVLQIAFFWVVLQKNNCRIKISRTSARLVTSILKYCAPMAVFTMVNALNRDMDKYLISMMTDTETLALYANASKQLPFDILMASFCTVLIPYITRYISEQKKEQAANLYKSFLEIAYVSTGVLCGAALAAAPQLMKLLYSNKYTEGLWVFVVYILVDLFRFTNITLILSAAGKTRMLMLLGVCSLGCNAVLNIVLYHCMHLIGPAIATLLVTVIMGIVMLLLSARTLNARLRHFFDTKYLTWFLVQSVILTAALTLLQQTLEKRGVHYFWILLMIAGTYGLVMLLLNGRRLLHMLKSVNRISEN